MRGDISFQRLPVTSEMAEEFNEPLSVAFIGTPEFWGGIMGLMLDELKRNPDDKLLSWVLRQMEADLGITRPPMEILDPDR